MSNNKTVLLASRYLTLNNQPILVECPADQCSGNNSQVVGQCPVHADNKCPSEYELIYGYGEEMEESV